MNDHNLDDLIIDNIEPNQKKTKGFMTIVALLIVFLIVGIILFNSYSDETKTNSATLEAENPELIAPELILQAPAKIPKTKKEPSLSSIMEEEINAPKEKSEEIIPEPTVTPSTVVKKPAKVEKETVEIDEEYIPEAPEPKVTKTKPVVKKHTAQKPVKKVTKHVKRPKTVTHITYYIQVGSFSQNPSSRFLSVIRKSGFHYHISKANSRGIKKLLIGPYSSRASVDSALTRVRDRINKKAFVVKK